MSMVVGEDVTDALVQHGKERGESSESCKVHDVVQSVCMLQTSVHQAIKSKVRSEDGHYISLNLKVKPHEHTFIFFQMSSE